MTSTDVIAIVGALAWLPPIVIGLRAWLTKPVIRVITQPAPEVGFTTLGPIVNVRVALTATHRDVVITAIRLRVTHESGEVVLYSWRGIVQRMGTMTYPQLGAVPFEKESNVLAMKVSQRDIEERFIRFQSGEFLQGKAELEDIATKKFSHLRQSPPVDVQAFLKGSELLEVYAYVRQTFPWKPGSYRLKFELDSPDVFAVLDDEYTFSLSPHQVQGLSDNLRFIEPQYANDLLPIPPDGKLPPIPWNWTYPDMRRIDG